MTITPNINGEEITVHDRELASKLLAQWKMKHTDDFMQRYARNELIAALRKEAKEWDSSTA